MSNQIQNPIHVSSHKEARLKAYEMQQEKINRRKILRTKYELDGKIFGFNVRHLSDIKKEFEGKTDTPSEYPISDMFKMFKKGLTPVEYNPAQFPGAVFRIKKPKTATLLFKTGKMVCTGSKSSEMARKAVDTVVDELKKGKIKIKNKATVTIQNIVAAINLGGKVHLEQAARTLPRSMYEPEQFPGVIHRMIEPKSVILIFSSGKLVCTGCKTESDVYRAVNHVHSLLEEKGLMMYD